MNITQSAMSKKTRTAAWFDNHASFGLQCIHCRESLKLENQTLQCENRHSFDMAKQGYFFLAKKSVDDKYDQHLFAARRTIIQSSPLYQGLHTALLNLLKQQRSPLTILDAGCGEGSHLHCLCCSLQEEVTAIAVDLAKTGVQQASDYAGQMLPIVADLSRLPIANQQVDVILSILSPANYQEFKRVLKPGGIVIKVIPNAQYLVEVRQALSRVGWTTKEDYSNKQIRNVFRDNMTTYNEIPIRYKVNLSEEQQAALLEMTPLTWQLSPEQRKQLLSLLSGQITLDVAILVGSFDGITK
ncbi:methyltransferase domain-containing protein [Aerococcaceae bacterium NML130460]|nr:methyltransferase domain-containing protein [Aerococcaceae bacterium NML130460]